MGPETGATRRWLVIAADGRIVAAAEVPSRRVGVEVGESRFLAITRDEYDIESVTLHAVVR